MSHHSSNCSGGGAADGASQQIGLVGPFPGCVDVRAAEVTKGSSRLKNGTSQVEGLNNSGWAEVEVFLYQLDERFIGYLAGRGISPQQGQVDFEELRRAVIYGSVMGSFCCESFGVDRFRTLTREEIEDRYREFKDCTDF